MRCPVDDTDLVMADRQGIEIDYCPKCRGVWLDRGELDKIIERAAGDGQAPASRRDNDDTDDDRDRGSSRSYEERREPRNNYDEDNYRGSEERYDDHRHGKKRKKEGFLGDLFDF